MTEIVEKAAMALHLHDADKPRPFDTLGYRQIMYGDGPAVWDNLAEPAKDIFRAQALAAIEAMREPTEAQLKAGDGADWASDFDPSDPDSESRTGNVYRAMIDAALKT